MIPLPVDREQQMRYVGAVRYLFLAAMVCISSAAQDEGVPTFGTTVVISAGLKGDVFHLHHGITKWMDLRKKKPEGTIYTTSLNIPPQDLTQGFPGVTRRVEWFAI